MDGLCTLYPPKCKFLTRPFKWRKKKITKSFQQYVQDAIMIQAVTGHFMEDVNTPQNGFLFLLLTKVEPLGKDCTSLIQTPLLIYITDSFQCPKKILIYFL